MNSRALASTGSVLSALASSACCWLPLLLMGVGLSAAGIGTFFERFRPLFLIIAAVLLGLGFYLNYFRKERCEPGSTCERPNPRLRKMNRGMLWTSTALVLTFALFPSYVGHLFGVQPTAAESTAASTDTWTIDIHGMTCAGCEAAVNQSLAEVPGVLRAEASYDAAGATITVDPSTPPTRMALAAAVGKAGYSLVSVGSEQPVATKPELAGHWVTDLEEQNGEMIEVIMDLGVVNSRWIGEFDLPKYNVMNYPVEVKTTGDTIELFLTAIGMSFEGSIGVDGLLTGVGQSQGAENEPVTFRRTGPAEFSEGFLELEAAADDPFLVEILSDDGSELRERFNTDREKTRLLMLLSPT
jgi:mercuric ion transport protein